MKEIIYLFIGLFTGGTVTLVTMSLIQINVGNNRHEQNKNGGCEKK